MKAHYKSDCVIDCWTGIATLKQLHEMLEKAHSNYDNAKTPTMKAHCRILIERIEAGIDAREVA